MANKLNPRQLHELNDIYDEKYRLSLIHVYNRLKNCWQFHGFNCKVCGLTLKSHKHAEKHYKHCKIAKLKKNQHKYNDDSL